MTYQDHFTLPTELLEQVAEQGLDFLPELIRIVVNNAMQAEREEHLGVGPYERSIKRRGHSNGFKPKTVTTRMAPITGAGSALLIAWNGFVKKSVGAPEWPGYFQVRLHACVW